jgi:hypothetical protein
MTLLRAFFLRPILEKQLIPSQRYDGHFFLERCSFTSAWVSPSIATILLWLVCPLKIVMWSFFILRTSPKNSISSLLALPFSGGAAILIFQTSLDCPITSFLPALGWTLIDTLIGLLDIKVIIAGSASTCSTINHLLPGAVLRSPTLFYRATTL